MRRIWFIILILVGCFFMFSCNDDDESVDVENKDEVLLFDSVRIEQNEYETLSTLFNDELENREDTVVLVNSMADVEKIFGTAIGSEYFDFENYTYCIGHVTLPHSGCQPVVLSFVDNGAYIECTQTFRSPSDYYWDIEHYCIYRKFKKTGQKPVVLKVKIDYYEDEPQIYESVKMESDEYGALSRLFDHNLLENMGDTVIMINTVADIEDVVGHALGYKALDLDSYTYLVGYKYLPNEVCELTGVTITDNSAYIEYFLKFRSPTNYFCSLGHYYIYDKIEKVEQKNVVLKSEIEYYEEEYFE